LREVFLQIFKHSIFVGIGLDNRSLGTFDHVFHPFTSAKLSHVVDNSYLETTSVEIIILGILYLHNENQRIVDDIVVTEVIKRRSQVFQHVIFTKNRLALPINQEIDIEGYNGRFRETPCDRTLEIVKMPLLHAEEKVFHDDVVIS
jgi:hypothetical protein